MQKFPIRLVILTMFSVPLGLVAGEDEGLSLKPQTRMMTNFPKDEATPVFIEADQLGGIQNATIEAEGEVELRKRGQVMNADRMVYDQNSDNLHAAGNVRLEQQGASAQGPELFMNLGDKRGYMKAPAYQMSKPDAHGTAEQLDLQGNGKYRISVGDFTTCAEGKEDWILFSKELELDRTTEIGTAWNSSVYFKGVPLFYSPWLSFPLSDKRKSGFLVPSAGSSDSSGLEFAAPYYWNIAPNQDATLTPRVMSKRGLQLAGDYRYLGSTYQGNAQAAVLPHDNKTGEQRYAVALHHNQSLGSGWAGGLNIQSVSDDNYFRDLTNNLSNTAQNNLPREGVLAYHGNGIAFLGRVQKFQTLQDPLTPITPPYSRAPQLLLNGAWDVLPAMSTGLSAEWVDFQHTSLVSGQRFTLYPSLSLPLSRSYGYVTPKLGVHYTNYAITENNFGQLPDSVRTLPIFSVDSGLFFERPVQFGGHNLLQTLEPRLFYLNIPYKDQNNLPLFDTALSDFNYAMMFSENQFIGGDRINDANQITFAVTTRLIDADNGQEGVRATIGQRFYFKDQQVLLDYAGAQADTSSDILASVGGKVAAAWSVDVTTQYQPSLSEFQRTGASVSYQPAIGKVLNLGYRFNLEESNPIKQVDLSAQWPLSRGWQGVGRWNYSLRDDKVLEGLLGLEYNAGCWAARIVAHRFVTTAVETNDSIYFQLELSGLGRLGTNPLDILKRNIYGYSSLNQTNATTYDQH